MDNTPPALHDLAAVRAYVAAQSAALDPHSRYIPELLAFVNASAGPADLERRLLAGCRGQRHAGPAVFAAMPLHEKLLANLITPETTLFRFTEGELEALDREILPRLHGRKARILVVPCSLGDEAFTMAAFLLKVKIEFEIHACDIQPQLIAAARTGRLTFGYPLEFLETPGKVGPEVLSRIAFEVADAFNLPHPPCAAGGETGAQRPSCFDVILCRNFVGYFTPQKAHELVHGLAARLAPGGVLFLDSFCVNKFPALAPELHARGLRRQGDRPVFLHAGTQLCP